MKRALVAALLLVGCAHLPKQANAPAAKATTATVAPGRRTVRAIDAAGLKAYLEAHRGRPLVVNVFASWCTPCRAELPDLAKLATRAPKLQLLGLDVDAQLSSVLDFLPSVPAAMDVVHAPAGVEPLLSALSLPADWNESFPAGWDLTVPLTFVYDASGAFVTGSVGQLGPEALDAIVAVSR